jgi:hypothetical protein
MKRFAAIPMFVAAICFAALGSQSIYAQSNRSMNSTATADPPSASIHEATEMVLARATLAQSIDARQIHADHALKATLYKSVQLKNGPELPRGTELIGTVAPMKQANGATKLALRFTKAQLKDGQTVPIRATIVGMTAPNYNSYEGLPPDSLVNTWNPKVLQVDQIGALPGVNLHSRIGSRESGVLDASGTNDFKLQRSSRLDLAIAARRSNT